MSNLVREMAGVVLAVVLAAPAFAQETVYVVRHAERADSNSPGPPVMGADPSLSARGRARAVALASVLRDAGISTIFVTEFKRTQETAAPLAKALGLTPVVVKANDTASLLTQVKAARGHALVVGHSNTVPDIVKGLGVSVPVTVGDADFDHLFVVLPSRELIHLHFP